MAYKKLTDKGIKFIRSKCNGDGNGLLSGSNSYPLKFSSDMVGTIYTANAVYNKKPITSNGELGEALINWISTYSNDYDLDANIIAAQLFNESGYKLWAFPKPKENSSAQGISQFLSSTIYDVIIANRGITGNDSRIFSEEEINKITKDLSEPRQLSSYKYINSNSDQSIAKLNRNQLFQNCMDNPDLLIKAQCRYMKSISTKAANNAASTLFGYNQGPSIVERTVTLTLKNGNSILDSERYKNGLKYIKNIFTLLRDSFGYSIDFTFDPFVADLATSGIEINNLDSGRKLTPNYTLDDLIKTSKPYSNIPSESEIERLKIFAANILEPLTKIYGKFIINSSFRSEVVNSLVGGVITSQHRRGEAADIRIETNDGYLLERVFNEIVANKTVKYDQIIYEVNGSSILNRWIHISYNTENPEKNKSEALKATKINGTMKFVTYIPPNSVN